VNRLPAWVDAHLSPAVRAVVVDERGALAELDFPGSKVRPHMIGHRDVAVACGLFWDGVTEGTLNHRGQIELTKAVLGAKQRPMMAGQASGWDGKAPNSSVLIACTLALFGVSVERPTRPRPSTKHQVVRVLR